MKISVVGAGYVGLITGVSFASFGHKVACIDKNVDAIQKLQNGQVPFLSHNSAPFLPKNKQPTTLRLPPTLTKVCPKAT